MRASPDGRTDGQTDPLGLDRTAGLAVARRQEVGLRSGAAAAKETERSAAAKAAVRTVTNESGSGETASLSETWKRRGGGGSDIICGFRRAVQRARFS